MAAQEYYHPNSPAPRPAGPYSGAQGYPQSPVPSNSIPASGAHGPPPPYSEMAPAQPPPQPQYHSDDKPQNGQRQGYNYNQPQYQPAVPSQTYYQYHYPDPPQTQYYSQQYYYPQQQTQQYQQPQQYNRPVYASGALAQANNIRPHSQPPPQHADYRRDSRSGSRHRYDHHHRHHSSDRRHGSESTGKKKGRLDTFVGAGGGAIIGDAIFPGLGTVGGALLGGLGGHRVAEEKRRRSVEDHKYRRERSRGHYYDDEDERVGRRRY